MGMKKKMVRIVLAVIGVCMFAGQSWAVPNFSRTTGLTCNQCHDNFPQLNSFGREFLQNGYVRTGETEDAIELSETLSLSKHPFGALVKLRPYDVKKSGSTKMRSFHELEIFLAGTVGNVLGRNISYFTEIESEDEFMSATQNGFELQLQGFELGWHLMPELNILVGNRPLADTDPLQTLSNHGRVTRNKRAMFSKKYGSGETQGRKQNVGVDGIIAKSILYGFKYGADVGDDQGSTIENAADTEARLAFLLPIEGFGDVALGGYYKNGSQLVGNAFNLDFTRKVVDIMVDCMFGRYVFAFQHAEDEQPAGGMTAYNNGFYVEGSYGILKDDKPFIVPTVRLDQYETGGGADDNTELTLNVAYFLRENVKAYLEYWQQLDAVGSYNNNRLTLQIEVGL